MRVEDLLPGIEKKLGSKILGVRGSVDLLFSGVIIELKLDLVKEWPVAHDEMVKYFQSLREERPNQDYVSIATDLVRFRAFQPVVSNGIVIDVSEIGSINAGSSSWSELLIWLDAFLFSSTNRPPTAEDLKIRFGAGSPTYAIVTRELQHMWSQVVSDPAVNLKKDLWSRNMQIVYGKEPQETVFVDHTYVVTLVKLIVFMRLSGAKIVSEDLIRKALNGSYFAEVGIPTLIEEDFFSWILAPDISARSLGIAAGIVQALQRYDLSLVDEDLFKEIYQQIVGQGERHRVGEYYTPEWLSELTTEHAFNFWLKNHEGTPHVLDPACGSGTFITNSIHRMKSLLSEKVDKSTMLEMILDHVMGLDVNPLAVTISRANYIIALGDLVQYAQNISIPVYNADSIRILTAVSTMLGSTSVHDLEVDNLHIQIPTSISSDRARLGRVVSALREALSSYHLRKNRPESKRVFSRGTSSELSEDEAAVMESTLETLMKLDDEKKDSIWVFMINNLYAPLFMKERKFDILLSNPPWLVMRSIESESYQNFLKKQIFAYDLLEKNQIRLYPHMEMATLFFCRTTQLYLKEGGEIAFLMPIAVITASEQHVRFKSFRKPPIELNEILNFEKVSEIFSLPVCVLVGTKGGRTRWPIPMTLYKGKISAHNRNVRLSSVLLTSAETVYTPPEAPKKSGFSDYYGDAREGSSIVPRNFWFVEFVPHPTLRTIDASRPLVKTSEKSAEVSKKGWKDVRMKGNVEAEYIFATLLGKDTIPFGHLSFRPVVLPASFLSSGVKLLTSKQVQASGAIHFAEWVGDAQKIWEARRTAKAEESFPKVEDRLDFHGLLSDQNPSRSFAVLYNGRGADSFTCVVNRNKIPDFEVDHTRISPAGFIADYTTFVYETNDEDDAHYLCAVLNSKVVHKGVKQFQPQGKYGKRDIGRRVFQLPIPRFNRNDSDHRRLVTLSRECHQTIETHNFTKKGFRGMRFEATRILIAELMEIDSIVRTLIS